MQIRKLTDFDKIEPRENYYVSEGMCPNKCGPMKRTGVHEAICPLCEFVFLSKRIQRIFPSRP